MKIAILKAGNAGGTRRKGEAKNSWNIQTGRKRASPPRQTAGGLISSSQARGCKLPGL
jgi:hypothetical protein